MKIPTDVLVQCSQVGTLVLGSLGVWVAMLNQRRQLNAQMFITITGRFQELLRLFPTEAWLANRNANQPLPPRNHDTTDCTLYCLQLIMDVYHLRQGRYISNKLWYAWEREIKHILEGRIFRREWEWLQIEFSHHDDFLKYINELMTPNPMASAGPPTRRPASAPCDPSTGGS
jgi:hypothetical protein